MPWIEALLRGQRVLARANASGELAAEGGRVEIRYKPRDGRSYRAASANLAAVPGSPVLPDSHCGDAVPASDKKGDAAGVAAASPKVRKAKSGAAPRKISPMAIEPVMPGDVVVYTDGACSGNPGPAGCGFIVLDPDTGAAREGYEYLGIGTNNVAELTAILRGVEAVANRAARVRVHTDSLYAIGVLQKGWKAKANPELVTRIRTELATRPRTVLVYVPGHAGVPLNERADELAREAVKTRGSRPLVGARP